MSASCVTTFAVLCLSFSNSIGRLLDTGLVKDEDPSWWERQLEASSSYPRQSDDGSAASSKCDPVEYRDDRCVDYCNEFLRLCFNPDFFDEFGGGYDGCLAACAQYPRSRANSSDPVTLGGDTLQCREQHLGLVTLYQHPPSFHCVHAAPDGGGICTDVTLDGLDTTPFQAMRRGACSHKTRGFCNLFADDRVADCSFAGLDDGLLPGALRLLPDTIEVLFLTRNGGITTLTRDVFTNLPNGQALRALYADGCSIDTLESDSFSGLTNLEILNLNVNRVRDLPSGILKNLVKLEQFSMHSNLLNDTAWDDGKLFEGQRGGSFKRLELYGHKGITGFPPGLFEGLSELELLSMVDCSIDDSIGEDIFDPLVSLKYWDFFLNSFRTINKRWFVNTPGLNRIQLWANPFNGTLPTDAFEFVRDIKHIYLHFNPDLDISNPAIFSDLSNLVTLTKCNECATNL